MKILRGFCFILILSVTTFFSFGLDAVSFQTRQLRYPRVGQAKLHVETKLKELFREKKLNYPPSSLFIRIFKDEKKLEIWVKKDKQKGFVLLKEYPMCSSLTSFLSLGKLGPKREEGDGHIPEGFYRVSAFNPTSQFHLSLKINYPNESDLILGKKGKWGGDIFIHGGCASIGCVPMTDEQIEEIYWLAVLVQDRGQKEIPVHIFPIRFSVANVERLKKDFGSDEILWNFWLSLKEGFDFFEKEKKIPKVTVNKKGRYIVH